MNKNLAVILSYLDGSKSIDFPPFIFSFLEFSV